MFKSKKEQTTPAGEPVNPMQAEARQIVERGERIRALAADLEMWRKFAGGCKPGRVLFESGQRYYMGCEAPDLLTCRMDEDSAPLWEAFANRMAEERERRLREALGQ